MAYENIPFTIEAAIARLTLNRPDELNSFNLEMHAEVRDALAQAAAADRARACWCSPAPAGASAPARISATAPSRRAGERVDLGESIEKHYKPLVLALAQSADACHRGGQRRRSRRRANIALACDLVIATRSASFVQSFAKLGLVPDSGGTWLCRGSLALRARWASHCWETSSSAEQAAQWGLIWRCVEDTEFAARSMRSRSSSRSRRRAVSRAPSRRSTSRGVTRSSSSSTWSAICNVSSAVPQTTRKASPRLPRNASRSSSGVDPSRTP